MGKVILHVPNHFYKALCPNQWWSSSVWEVFAYLDLNVSVFKAEST